MSEFVALLRSVVFSFELEGERSKQMRGYTWWEKGKGPPALREAISRVCARTIRIAGAGKGARKAMGVTDMVICRAMSPRSIPEARWKGSSVYNSTVSGKIIGEGTGVDHLTSKGELSLPGGRAKTVDGPSPGEVKVFFGMSETGSIVTIGDLAVTLQTGIEVGVVDPVGVFTTRLSMVDSVVGVTCSMRRMDLAGLEVLQLHKGLVYGLGDEWASWGRQWARCVFVVCGEGEGSSGQKIRILTGLIMCITHVCCNCVDHVRSMVCAEEYKDLLRSLRAARDLCSIQTPPPGTTVESALATIYSLVMIARQQHKDCNSGVLVCQTAVVLRAFMLGGSIPDQELLVPTAVQCASLYSLLVLLMTRHVVSKEVSSVCMFGDDVLVDMKQGPPENLSEPCRSLPKYQAIIGLMETWIGNTRVAGSRWQQAMRGCTHAAGSPCECMTDRVVNGLLRHIDQVDRSTSGSLPGSH